MTYINDEDYRADAMMIIEALKNCVPAKSGLTAEQEALASDLLKYRAATAEGADLQCVLNELWGTYKEIHDQ